MHTSLFDSLKGERGFLSLQRPQCSFPTHPTKTVLLKAEKFKGWVIFSTSSPIPPPTEIWWGVTYSSSQNRPPCIPNSILRQPEGELFANNDIESWPRASSIPQGVATPCIQPTSSYCPLPLILISHQLAEQIPECYLEQVPIEPEDFSLRFASLFLTL